VEQAGAADAGR